MRVLDTINLLYQTLCKSKKGFIMSIAEQAISLCQAIESIPVKSDNWQKVNSLAVDLYDRIKQIEETNKTISDSYHKLANECMAKLAEKDLEAIERCKRCKQKRLNNG